MLIPPNLYRVADAALFVFPFGNELINKSL